MFPRFESLVDPFQAYSPETPPQKVWAFLVHHLRPLRAVMAASVALTAIGAGIEIWLVWYAGRLVDMLSTTPPETLWAEFGAEFILVALVLLVLRPVSAFLNESLDDIAFRPNAVSLIRWRAHRHVLRQSVDWFRRGSSGELASRVRELGNAATGVAYSVIHTLAYVVFYMAGSFWLMASVDIRLGIPLALWLLLYIALSAFSVPRFRDHTERFQQALTNLSGLLVDTYANIDTIKLFANLSEEDRESRERFRNARAEFIGVQRFEVTINVGMVVLGNLLLVGLVGYAMYLWSMGDAPLGLVAAALALSIRISSMAEWMLDAMSYLFGQIGAARESLKSVSQPSEITDAPGAPELILGGGAISFVDVSHHYRKGGNGLDGVSIEIAAGEKIGLVGRSGAGKSTFVNLILRFFEAEGGRIEIDGQNIRSVTQESLRRHISMVTQDAALLHRSVRDNIAYGRPDLDLATVEAAARKAAADGFIPSLRDLEGRTGYDAHVGERGVRLSGGQRQRIALARAILKDAPILVLDEATSALDSEVEAAIQDTLYDVMEGKTVIAIAHRLSTIARMDRIAVLDGGRVAERGTHDELLALGGIYAGLWARQSGGFLGI
jgi:ATP-binding cassette subfamily B multidrug efflux pump